MITSPLSQIEKTHMSNMTAASHDRSLDIDETFDYLMKQFMNETLHFHIIPNF